MLRAIVLALFVIAMCGWAKADDKPADAAVKFYGVADAAKKVVYVLDHSGSMLDTFDSLRQEAIRSVNALAPEQAFSVVMFSEAASVIFPKLQQATPEAKRDFAMKLAAYRAQGMNDDLLDPFERALEAAFKMEPEVIYFLTDGRFDPRLTDFMTKLNKDKKVRLHTLAFVNNDAAYKDQLKELAKKNGGSYKFISGQDALAPEVKFYGVSDTANKVVYVLDHGGSMLDTLDFLRQEAIRSVNALRPEQSFSVGMFSAGGVSVGYPEVQKITPEVKKDFAEKLQKFRAQGHGDDGVNTEQKAFEAAFKLQPEVIYFLTDGRFDQRVINVVTNDLNKNKKVRVNTLGFVSNDPTSEDQLKELAKKNGGVYKFVSEKELGK